MAKIIFDDGVILSQGRDLLGPADMQHCICIEWEVDGFHKSWVRVPDNYEVQADANGDIHVKKKETYFTGKIVVTPYTIREQASGANKKVIESGDTAVVRVDAGGVCSGRHELCNAIRVKFGRLIDNEDTRTAVDACIREEFYNGNIFKYYSGITIEWENRR